MRRATFGLAVVLGVLYAIVNVAYQEGPSPGARAAMGILLGLALGIGGAYARAGNAAWAITCFTGAFLFGLLGHVAGVGSGGDATAFLGILAGVVAILGTLSVLSARQRAK